MRATRRHNGILAVLLIGALHAIAAAGPAAAGPRVVPVAGPARFVAFAPDGRTVVTATTEAKITVVDAETGETERTLAIPGLQLAALAVSPDGRTLAAVGFSGEAGEYRGVRRVDLMTGREIATPLEDDRLERVSLVFAPAIAFSPDGRVLAASAGPDANEVALWDTTTGRRLARLDVPRRGNNGAARLAFSPDGSRLAVAGTGGVSVWEVATGRRLAVLQRTNPATTTLAWGRDGRLAGESVGAIRFWDPATGELRAVLSKAGRVYPAPPGTYFLDTPEERFEFARSARTAAFDGSLGLLACALIDMRRDRTEFGVELWTLKTGARRVALLEGHTDWVESLALSPDARTLATLSDDGTLRLWPVPAIEH